VKPLGIKGHGIPICNIVLCSTLVIRLPSMTSYTTLLAYSSLALAGYALAWIAYARLLHPLKHIPGPFWASISRLWIVHYVRRGDMDIVQRGLHQKYGPLVRIGPDEIACAAPEAISKIYPTSKPLAKQHGFYSVWQNKSFSKYPDNFSNTNERLHSERRRIVNNVYSMSTILSLEPYIDDCSRLFVQRMGEFADSHTVVDLGDWLQWYVRSSFSVPRLLKLIATSTGMHSTSSASSSLESGSASWRTRMITEAT
jgi:hypothetical protein